MGTTTKQPCAGPAGPYCWMLEDRLEDTANARVGLSIVRAASLTGAVRTYGVAHKRGKKDRGLMLNHCPWCGADIAPVELKKREASDAAE